MEPFRPRPHFEIDNRGVWWVNVRTDKDGDIIESEPQFLSDSIDIIGTGQDNDGAYYRIIKFKDKITRQQKTAALPQAEIADGKCWGRLGFYGLSIESNPTKRRKLADYLQKEGSQTAFTITDRAGWHEDSYIMPSGETITATDKDPAIIYNGDTSQAKAYQPNGELTDWQQNIARYAVGNSRLCLALGASFAAPLLSLLNEESGGFHLMGDSSDGKTTAAKVALSVWGKPSGSLLSWSGTKIGFSNTAAARNDGLLVLDEIGQASPHVIGDTVYSVMNGINKVQGAKQGGNRALSRWKVMMFSTGEKTPDSILKHNKGDWNAGQAARLPSIRAAAQYGIYDTLHGFEDGALLSEHIAQSAEKYHGTAGRLFIQQLLDDLEQAKQQATERMAAFMATIPELSGQARRVAKRFAIAAAALELAAPVTGLPVGVGMAGVKKCFDEWLEANGAGKHEDRRIIEQAEDFIAQHALGTRFMEWSDKSTNKDHAGYRKQEGEKLELWVIRRVFADEIAQSFDEAKVCRVLVDNGLLKYNHKNRGYQHQRKGNGWFHVLATNIELDD
ncbi:helicase [Neisseria sp. HMSC067H04]|nr:helicase [Neisseria sp. HMSC067H04]OFR71509.1 helicase [Neisseria sp. HMSC067G12]